MLLVAATGKGYIISYKNKHWKRNMVWNEGEKNLKLKLEFNISALGAFLKESLSEHI